ncbi:hypothetical protein GCM10025877_32260 [Agromyces mangrovi Wang et al. 2018]|nr:hypothetical protein GCM10025877_32260 [Agromyces mangrovi]
MIQFLQLPRPCAAHRQSGLPERTEQVGLRVGLHGAVERRADLGLQLLEATGLASRGRAVAECGDEHRLVHIASPGDAAGVDLGGDEGPGRLGGEEQAQPGGIRAR